MDMIYYKRCCCCYYTAFLSRKLVWIYSMGHCNVKAMYKKKIELVISPLQAAVLVLFNETDSLTFKTIQETTGIPDEDLGRVMQSLTSSKSKLLEKNAGSNPTDPLYSVNTSFTSPVSSRARLCVRVCFSSLANANFFLGGGGSEFI